MDKFKIYYYNRTYELLVDCFIKIQELSERNEQLNEVCEKMNKTLKEFKLLNDMDKVAKG